MQLADGIFPASAINEIVPVRDEIADGTARLAERNSAVHAASTLLAKLVFRKILVDFEPVVHALEHRTSRRQFPRVIHEAGGLTHVAPALLHLLCTGEDFERRTRDVSLLATPHSEHALEFMREYFDEARSRILPIVEDPLRPAAAGQFRMACNQVADDLYVAGFE